MSDVVTVWLLDCFGVLVAEDVAVDDLVDLGLTVSVFDAEEVLDTDIDRVIVEDVVELFVTFADDVYVADEEELAVEVIECDLDIVKRILLDIAGDCVVVFDIELDFVELGEGVIVVEDCIDTVCILDGVDVRVIPYDIVAIFVG